MVRRIDLMALNFYKKEPLTGSLSGMRYRISLTGEEENSELSVVVYPDEVCFEKTDESKKQYYSFPFSEEGLQQITAFLNEKAVTYPEA